MPKYQQGFGLVILFPLLFFALLMLSHQFEKLFFLQTSYLQWKTPSHLLMDTPQKQVLLNQHPCVLLCQKDCVSAELWKIQYEQAVFFILKPLKSNHCRQKKVLKMYHSLVSWRFTPKL